MEWHGFGAVSNPWITVWSRKANGFWGRPLGSMGQGKKQYNDKEGEFFVNKLGFVFSGSMVLIGLVAILLTGIVNEVMPIVGRIAFQTVASGQFNPIWYLADFSGVTIIAVLAIVFGLGGIAWFYRKEERK